MIPTRKSIEGEVFRIRSTFHLPMTETYMKLFNSKAYENEWKEVF